MSAAELRQAADTLRARASHESVPQGEWFIEDDGDGFNVLCPDPDMPGFPWDVARDLPEGSEDPSPIAVYIATMHPGVGVALADVLDAHAEEIPNDSYPRKGSPFHRLVTLINGGGA